MNLSFLEQCEWVNKQEPSSNDVLDILETCEWDILSHIIHVWDFKFTKIHMDELNYNNRWEILYELYLLGYDVKIFYCFEKEITYDDLYYLNRYIECNFDEFDKYYFKYHRLFEIIITNDLDVINRLLTYGTNAKKIYGFCIEFENIDLVKKYNKYIDEKCLNYAYGIYYIRINKTYSKSKMNYKIYKYLFNNFKHLWKIDYLEYCLDFKIVDPLGLSKKIIKYLNFDIKCCLIRLSRYGRFNVFKYFDTKIKMDDDDTKIFVKQCCLTRINACLLNNDERILKYVLKKYGFPNKNDLCLLNEVDDKFILKKIKLINHCVPLTLQDILNNINCGIKTMKTLISIYKSKSKIKFIYSEYLTCFIMKLYESGHETYIKYMICDIFDENVNLCNIAFKLLSNNMSYKNEIMKLIFEKTKGKNTCHLFLNGHFINTLMGGYDTQYCFGYLNFVKKYGIKPCHEFVNAYIYTSCCRYIFMTYIDTLNSYEKKSSTAIKWCLVKTVLSKYVRRKFKKHKIEHESKYCHTVYDIKYAFNNEYYKTLEMKYITEYNFKRTIPEHVCIEFLIYCCKNIDRVILKPKADGVYNCLKMDGKIYECEKVGDVNYLFNIVPTENLIHDLETFDETNNIKKKKIYYNLSCELFLKLLSGEPDKCVYPTDGWIICVNDYIGKFKHLNHLTIDLVKKDGSFFSKDGVEIPCVGGVDNNIYRCYYDCGWRAKEIRTDKKYANKMDVIKIVEKNIKDPIELKDIFKYLEQPTYYSNYIEPNDKQFIKQHNKVLKFMLKKYRDDNSKILNLGSGYKDLGDCVNVDIDPLVIWDCKKNKKECLWLDLNNIWNDDERMVYNNKELLNIKFKYVVLNYVIHNIWNNLKNLFYEINRRTLNGSHLLISFIDSSKINENNVFIKSVGNCKYKIKYPWFNKPIIEELWNRQKIISKIESFGWKHIDICYSFDVVSYNYKNLSETNCFTVFKKI